MYVVVRGVPRGRVATYGLVAAMLGNPRWSRQVGWALHACDDPEVPCHRVVFADGRLAPDFPEQRRRLIREGVAVRGDVVDMARHAWRPRAHVRVP